MSGAVPQVERQGGPARRDDPDPPLFVHEYHSASAILDVMRSRTDRDRKEEMIADLFGDSDLDVEQRIDAYDHKGDWGEPADPRRLPAGDELAFSCARRRALGARCR